jgi:4-hydroxybenzoate polyprenyltransferase
MKFLKSIGIEYLLLLAFTMLLFRFGFLEQQPHLPLALSKFQHILLVIGAVCIAAGGFLINSITNTTDGNTINEDTGYYIYGAFTLVGLGIGFYLCDYIGHWNFLLFFALIVGTLYFYATNLKQSLLLGNIVIAFIAVMIFVAIGVFNLYPVVFPDNQSYLRTIFEILMDYGIFTFAITFILTLIIDLKNTDADYNTGINTLPIVLGRDRTVKAVFFTTLIPVAFLIYYLNANLASLTWAMGYCLLFILGPIIVFMFKLWSAKTQKDFVLLATILKIVLFFTAVSVSVITYNILLNAKG